MADLLHSPEIAKIESRYVSLFDRTIKKGLLGVAAPAIPAKVKSKFKSATFRQQLDQLIDDVVILGVDYTDKQITGEASATARAKLSRSYMSAASEVLPLTEELVRLSTELSDEVVQSILKMLEEEGIYQTHPNKLAKRITELWGGEKYRAVRFSRTFSADVANNTALHRHRQHKIRAWEFRAKLDERTTIQCQMLHGTIFYTDSDSSDRFRPPLHFHCRSSMWPVPITREIDESLVYENRDFSQLRDQEGVELDQEVIEKALGEISKFKDKYAIDKFILQEDIEKRLLKLKIGLENEKVELPTKKGKVPKPPKAPKPTKNELKVKELEDEIAKIDIEKDRVLKEYRELNDELDKIGYDPKDPEKYKLWKLKEEELYKKDNEYMDLLNKKDELDKQRRALVQKIAKDKIKKEKQQKEKDFLKNMPKTSQPKADQVVAKIPEIKAATDKKIDEVVKKRMALRDKAYELKQDYERKYNELLDQALEEKITEDEFNRLIGQLYPAEELDELNKEIARLTELQITTRKDTNKEIHKLLTINDGKPTKQFIKLDPRYSGPEDQESIFYQKRARETEETLDFFNRVMVQELRESLPNIQIEELTSRRAYTREGANKIWLGHDSETDTVIHEIGHNFEFNHVYMRESAYRHLLERTKGEKEQLLRDLTGNDNYALDEVAKKDTFFNPYVGKIYPDKSTEITSMALQYLYKDPEYLYDKDPELFSWIVNAVRGHYL
jgi:SPP1 gp7 family putative phage head morphogenesis protein